MLMNQYGASGYMSVPASVPMSQQQQQQQHMVYTSIVYFFADACDGLGSSATQLLIFLVLISPFFKLSLGVLKDNYKDSS